VLISVANAADEAGAGVVVAPELGKLSEEVEVADTASKGV